MTRATFRSALAAQFPLVTPLAHDALLGLFSGDAVGRSVVLEPATIEDMCAARSLAKPSLEVVYETA